MGVESFGFTLQAACATSGARAGVLHTPHGPLETPTFMPVGTLASVKALLPDDVRASGAQCVLANAYHLSLRPGADTIERLGGLHRASGWHGPMLTDSGGFQVLSLDKLRTIDDDGINFRSHLDGSPQRLTPERAVEVQEQLGADIVMPLDECTPYPCGFDQAAVAVRRTSRWAARCRDRLRRTDQALFGIVQGSVYAELRARSVAALLELDLPGYAIGGLSVGEPKDLTARTVAATNVLLPTDKPRYMMGVGAPEDLVSYMDLGVDMFDCVLPTRLGRNGTVFRGAARLSLGRSELRQTDGPLDPWCRCAVCANHSIAYLAHLHREREPLGARLASYHNVSYLVQLAREARAAILNSAFPEWKRDWLSRNAVALDVPNRA